MDSVQTNICKQESCILKCNLWKFFKALRVQANPIYCLLVASPVQYAWITIVDRENVGNQRCISIRQFISYYKNKSVNDKSYRLSINLYYLDSNIKDGRHIYEVTYRKELSVDVMRVLFPAMIAFHCAEAMSRGVQLQLTPQFIKYYKFKMRYIDEIQSIIERCNEAITQRQ